MNLKQLLNNKTAKNAIWLIGGKIGQVLVNLTVGLFMARYLGPSNYGLVSYGTAYTTFFASLANLGINSVLVKELIDHPNQEGKILGTSLFLRMISSVLSALMIIGIVHVVDAGEPETILIVSLCSLGLIFHIFEVINYWFQSRLKSKVTAIVTLIAYLLTALYKLALMVLGKDAVWFAFSTSFDYLCIGIMLLLVYVKDKGARFTVSKEYACELLKKSCHFILPGIMIAVCSQTDKIMLKQMVGETETGYYSTAISLCHAWCFVLTALIDSFTPSIMKLYNIDEKQFVRRNKQLYAMIFYLCALVSVVFTLTSDWLVSFLYGKEYLPVAPILKILTWYTAFSYLGGGRNAWVVCKGAQKHLLKVYFAAALVNVVLNSILIPHFGASGAAFASLCAQVMTTMVVPFFIPDLKENAKLMLEAICLKI